MLLADMPEAYALTGKTSMSVSATTVTVGDTVTVTVSISCKGGSIATMTMNYNSSYLKLTSYPNGDYNPSNGILIIDAASSDSGSRTFKFKTLASGSTTISFSVTDFYGMSGSVTGYDTALSKKITINKKQTTPSKTDNDKKETEVAKSTDATLSSLKVDGYSLSPKFASDVTEYKVYLPKNTSTLAVTAKATNKKAKVDNVTAEVKEGWNTISVVCTAESGKKKTYKIQAYVEENPDVFYTLNEKKVGVVKNLDTLTVPAGFEAEDLEVNVPGSEEKTTLTVFKWGAYDIVYLEDEEEVRGFYQYDRQTNTVTRQFRTLELAGRKFVETDFSFEEYPLLEEIMEQVTYVFEDGSGTPCLRYKDATMKDMRVFYVADENGQKHFYQLDTMENTLQRYFPPQPAPEEPEEPVKPDYMDYAMYGAGVIGLLSLLVSMIAVKRAMKN